LLFVFHYDKIFTVISFFSGLYNERQGFEMRLFQKSNLWEKISEALSSVLPVTAIVLILLIAFFPVSSAIFVAFLIGAVMLIFGMGLFTLGADTAMSPMGEYVGSRMTASKNIFVVILVSFFVGAMITISEPDLSVLAAQLGLENPMTLILAVGLGVGVMLVISMLRTILNIKLKYLLLLFYAAVFILTIWVKPEFLSVSFDSGGVTTGPMTVPFIMALGLGVSSISQDEGDSGFGMVALCSVGPILAVMIFGLINPDLKIDASAGEILVNSNMDSREVVVVFLKQIPHYMKEMAIALGPIVLFFFLFRLLFRGGANNVGKILVGVIYTYAGLVLFLTGVNVGFMPVGQILGSAIASSAAKWIIIPLGMLIGYFIVSAEPAVHVLTKQVEEVTSGAIPRRMLSLTLSVGVAISVGIAMLRALTGIPILAVLIPGYLIALVLTFIVPDNFTAIAFDSGGVASGPMTATFLLPFAIGACNTSGNNPVTDAFGVVAMVAMTPLIAIQILGLVYKIRLKKSEAAAAAAERKIEAAPTVTVAQDDEVIEL
jgi:hypothetical protein